MNPILRDTPTRLAVRRRDSGMTLIEVAITLSTLVGSMVILLASIVSAEAVSTTNKERHRALEDVSALMEQIETMPLSTIPATFAHNTAIPQFNDLHVKNQRLWVSYDQGNSAAIPLNFAVICTWTTATGAASKITIHGTRAR